MQELSEKKQEQHKKQQQETSSGNIFISAMKLKSFNTTKLKLLFCFFLKSDVHK